MNTVSIDMSSTTISLDFKRRRGAAESAAQRGDLPTLVTEIQGLLTDYLPRLLRNMTIPKTAQYDVFFEIGRILFEYVLQVDEKIKSTAAASAAAAAASLAPSVASDTDAQLPLLLLALNIVKCTQRAYQAYDADTAATCTPLVTKMLARAKTMLADSPAQLKIIIPKECEEHVGTEAEQPARLTAIRTALSASGLYPFTELAPLPSLSLALQVDTFKSLIGDALKPDYLDRLLQAIDPSAFESRRKKIRVDSSEDADDTAMVRTAAAASGAGDGSAAHSHSPSTRLFEDNPDLGISAGTLTAITATLRHANHLLAQVESGFCKTGFVLGRPPGHHACQEKAAGFCFVNTVAILAKKLLTKKENKVLILDLDAHHGGGTSTMLASLIKHGLIDPRQVHLVSLYAADTFDSRRTEKIFSTNIALPGGTKGESYRACLKAALTELSTSFTPTHIVVSAGFDTQAADAAFVTANVADSTDTSKGFLLGPSDFYNLYCLIMNFADTVKAKGPLFLLEGGYDLTALGKSVNAAISAIFDKLHPLPDCFKKEVHTIYRNMANVFKTADYYPLLPYSSAMGIAVRSVAAAMLTDADSAAASAAAAAIRPATTAISRQKRTAATMLADTDPAEDATAAISTLVEAAAAAASDDTTTSTYEAAVIAIREAESMSAAHERAIQAARAASIEKSRLAELREATRQEAAKEAAELLVLCESSRQALAMRTASQQRSTAADQELDRQEKAYQQAIDSKVPFSSLQQILFKAVTDAAKIATEAKQQYAQDMAAFSKIQLEEMGKRITTEEASSKIDTVLAAYEGISSTLLAAEAEVVRLDALARTTRCAAEASAYKAMLEQSRSAPRSVRRVGFFEPAAAAAASAATATEETERIELKISPESPLDLSIEGAIGPLSLDLTDSTGSRVARWDTLPASLRVRIFAEQAATIGLRGAVPLERVVAGRSSSR